MDLPEAALLPVLDRWPVARLATIRADGRPRLVPIVFARVEGGRLWSPIDGKPKRAEGSGGSNELWRVRDLARDPRVTLLLDHYDEDWERLWWLRIDGDAEVWRASRPGRRREIDAAAAVLRRKYPQYDDTPLWRDEPALLAISPGRFTGWCASARVAAGLVDGTRLPPARRMSGNPPEDSR